MRLSVRCSCAHLPTLPHNPSSLPHSHSPGANDAANSWGTSVASGAISVRSACWAGSLLEWLGAVALGGGVSTTVKKGVADIRRPDCWACGYCDSTMSLYMLGMLASLCAAAAFMILASYASMPVSTTHSIVGAIVGMTVFGTGWRCLKCEGRDTQMPFF